MDPLENNWGNLRVTLAQGRQLVSTTTGEVVLGSTIAKEFGRHIGDRIDLPVRPPDAKPDFVNHTFTVVGILNTTRTAPDTFAYINIADGQTLLRDSLPAAISSAIDVSMITEGIDVYGAPGTSLSDLDRLAIKLSSCSQSCSSCAATNSAAAEGVAARRSAAKSAMVKSVS